jgi:predicted TIM-barrel fold metal-dependent hydrolase
MTDAQGEYRGIYVRGAHELAGWIAARPSEPPLEPELPIIDAHQHFWDGPTRGRYLLPDFQADMAGGHRIVATVFVECRTMYRKDGSSRRAPLGEIEFANGIAAMSASGVYGPCRIAEAIVGYADLALGASVRDVLEAELAVSGGRLRAIRYPLTWDASEIIAPFLSRKTPQHQARDPGFREGLAQLAEFGLGFECWQYHPQLADAVELAHAFPDTLMIVGHAGGILGVGPYSGRREEVRAAWREGIFQLSRCANAVLKLGGLGMTCVGFDFHERPLPPSSDELAAAWRPYIETCIEAFGADRCIFESNFPPDKQSCGYTELWNAFKRITAGASAAEKAAIYAGTAARTYRLTAPS